MLLLYSKLLPGKAQLGESFSKVFMNHPIVCAYVFPYIPSGVKIFDVFQLLLKLELRAGVALSYCFWAQEGLHFKKATGAYTEVTSMPYSEVI